MEDCIKMMLPFTARVCVWAVLYLSNQSCSFFLVTALSGCENMQGVLPCFGLLQRLSFSGVDCRKHFLIA